MWKLVGVVALVNWALICRQAVFEKESVRDRKRRGVDRDPLFSLPSLENNWAFFFRENYTAPGQRLVPWVIAAQAVLAISMIIAVFP